MNNRVKIEMDFISKLTNIDFEKASAQNITLFILSLLRYTKCIGNLRLHKHIQKVFKNGEYIPYMSIQQCLNYLIEKEKIISFRKSEKPPKKYDYLESYLFEELKISEKSNTIYAINKSDVRKSKIANILFED